MSREQRRIESLYRRLLDCQPVQFPQPNQRLEAPTYKGVYLILGPRGAVLHVGSTPRAKNGIRQRLHGHLASRSSFVNIYMNNDGDLLREGYKFQYVRVANARQRALLEAYAIGQLLPKHIGAGESD